MKILPSLFLALSAPLATVAHANSLVFEETFNAPSSLIRLINGASRGGPASGVSGFSQDQAYTSGGATESMEPNGPSALANRPLAPGRLWAFTCTFWYRLEETFPDLQAPLETAGVNFLIHRTRGFEVRVSSSGESTSRGHSFFPGARGPHGDWVISSKWVFAAFSWDRQGNTLSVYQGLDDAPPVLMRHMSRTAPTTPTNPRDNLDAMPESIGNTFNRQTRPISGRLDNVRFYSRVLSLDELTTIHRADLQNQPVPAL